MTQTKRPRKVFGCLFADLDGGRVRFELRRDGLFVRRLYQRGWRKLTFTELLDAAQQQLRLF